MILWFNKVENSYNEETKHVFKNGNVWKVSLDKFYPRLGLDLMFQCWITVELSIYFSTAKFYSDFSYKILSV